MDDLARTSILDTLASRYGIRILNPGRWEPTHLQRVLKAVKDLAELMGDFASFQSEIRGARISRFPRETRFAAVSLPVLGVIYSESASWSDESGLRWQTVHELAHTWDMRKIFRLSRGLVRATGSKYRGCTLQFPVFRKYEPGGKWLPGRSAPLNALEDWADSVATYVYPSHAESLPENLGGPRLISRTRWDYVRQHMHIKLPYPADWDSRFDEPEISGETPSDC
jgi:hypothetical protein